MSDFALILPTRGRPGQCSRAIESCLANSECDVLVYLDEDDPSRHEYTIFNDDRVKTYFGPGRGKINAVNSLAAKHKEYALYMPITDDMVFVRNDWEHQAREEMAKFPNGIGIVSLSHSESDEYANWTVVSRNWVDTLGWVYYPQLSFYCPDTIIAILGHGTGNFTHIGPQAIRHDIINGPNLAERFSYDCQCFLWYCAKSFGKDLDKLRKAASA